MLSTNRFVLTIEVVPPGGPKAQPLLSILDSLKDLPLDGFSVATNPVAKPRMSAMALCDLIQRRTARPATLHLTTRDQNRLSLQGELWGARALGIETVLAATGDLVAAKERAVTTNVRDLDVFGLVRMAREAGLNTGVVLDPHPEVNGLKQAVKRLEQKVAAGAQFAVTQPLYDEAGVRELRQALGSISIPIIMGILPLRTPRHALFLHHKVSGIAVPQAVRDRMQHAPDPISQGVANAREMLTLARDNFSGACLMPPFDHYEILAQILA
jgi:homocysteine S-methyltransferase